MKNNPMKQLSWVLWLSLASACGVDPAAGDAGDDPQVTAAEQASTSYNPMGFARITAAGGVLKQFNKAGGAVTTTHSTGSYTVTFAGLGALVSADASGGHIQIAAEGAGNVRCRSTGWSGSTNLSATVQCTAADGTAADSAFAIQFFRYTMPAPTTWIPNAAYTWVQSSGLVSTLWDYNASGVHNTVSKVNVGIYAVTLTNATGVNASMMVTPYGGAAGTVCSIINWGAVTGGVRALVECRDRLGAFVDNAFSLSYSITGPTIDQQGAHAWFDGTVANTSYSSALGKVSFCSPASITGSRAGAVATLTVAGDLGPWDTSPFVRAWLASKYGSAGYCKVESQSSVEGAPSTATATVRCYTATGAEIATPVFTATHVTSDVTGPC